MKRIGEHLARVGGTGIALVAALALSAGPLLAECQNRDGTARECTPSENYGKCQAAADDAHAQCLEDANGAMQRGSCHIGRGVDGVGCAIGLIGDTAGELLG